MKLSIVLFASLAFGQTVAQKPEQPQPKPAVYPVNTAKYWKLVSAAKDAQIALLNTPQQKALDEANKAAQDEVNAMQAACAAHGQNYMLDTDQDKASPTFGDAICVQKLPAPTPPVTAPPKGSK